MSEVADPAQITRFSRADVHRIGRGLPAASLIDPIFDALERGPLRHVIEAPPGTGKTTLIPPAVASRTWPAPGGSATGNKPQRVVVTQPRRMAARAAARRLAQLTGTKLGELIGYTVRGDRHVCADTRVEFVTTGVLNRRMLANPELPGVSAVILDEIHERSLDTDLAAAFVNQIALLRDNPALDVVVMSATLDSARWANYFDAEVLRVQAESHELDQLWAAPEGDCSPAVDERGVRPQFLRHVATTAAHAVHETDQDVLVFLPGAREISRVAEHLTGQGRRLLPAHCEVHELLGSTPPARQDEILSPRASLGSDITGSGRHRRAQRIILATNVAESALTVPGVDTVVDAGLDRQQRLDTVRGVSGLVTVGAAKASMVQRAGRATRLGSGRVIRCLMQAEYAARPEYPPAEIATADLTDAVLMIAAWGEVDLPEPMPDRAHQVATDTLQFLGALDERGHITELGKILLTFPTEVRLARALVQGAPLVGARAAAEAVAVLSQDGRVAPGRSAVDAWGRFTALRDSPDFARESQRFQSLVSQYLTQPVPQGVEDGARAPKYALSEASLGLITALAAPDRLGKQRAPGSAEYLLVSGTAATLKDQSLSGEPWLAIHELGIHQGATIIRCAVPITQDTAERAVGVGTQRTVSYRPEAQRAAVREETVLGAIVLSSTPVQATAEEEHRALAQHLTDPATGAAVIERLNPSAEFIAWSQRLRFAHHHEAGGHSWPDLEATSPEFWADHRADLLAGLKTLIGWERITEFSVLVPERLSVPSGSQYRVDYSDPDKPVLAVKLQEMFGANQSPQVAGVPVLVHLLSPAGRPLAMTADLPFFWAEAYAQVRAENRARYAKHPWPEDPLTAQPTRLTTKRLRG